MANIVKYRDRLERAVTLSYMRVLSQFPIVKKLEERVTDGYIDLLTRRRERDWKDRALPSFIIIGGMKCGTSSLFKYLCQHPQLFGSSHKEVRFFAREDFYSQGEKWYRAHFPRLQDMPAGSLAFEATPDYLFFPDVASRMAAILPDLKLVALLRNPTERAISHYFHNLKKGREKQDILAAMEHHEAVYKRRGRYKEQIERYYNSFGPDRLKIVESERLFQKPNEALQDVYEFLGIERDFQVPDLSPKQVGFNRQPVRPEVYDHLNTYFQPLNEQLFDYLGYELHWDQP
jgi:hypothetical protein